MSIYKIERKLPGYIHVARIRDLFWNNNSDLYPNTVPDVSKYTRIDKLKPVFTSKYTGLINLQGEWNHAYYDGKYWFLVNMGVQDFANDVYSYQLIIDNMMNFLLEGGSIKGNLIRTNREDILAEVIQTCQPILETPARLEQVSFDINKFDWKKHCTIDIKVQNVDNFIDKYITQEGWVNYVFKIKKNIWGKIIYKSKWKLEDKPDPSYSDDQIVNPLYICDYLSAVKAPSWKYNIIGKLQEDFSTLENKIITSFSKVSESAFNGKYCITLNNDSMGSTVESNKYVEHIDLTNIVDVVPLDLITGNPKDPDKVPTVDDLISDQVETRSFPDFALLKLVRTPYLPIYNNQGQVEEDKFLPKQYTTSYTEDDYTDYTKDTGYRGNQPQTVIFKDDVKVSGRGDKRKGYLWYLNKNNFTLIDFNYSYWSSQEYDIDFLKNTLIQTTPSDDDREPFKFFYKHLPRTKIPSLGFIIWQLNNSRTIWDDYEYIGQTKLTKLTYRSGLNNRLIRNYEDEAGKWWRNVPWEVKYMNGVKELSYLTLDTALMTWLTIARPYKYYNKYKYYHNLNDWGIAQVYPDRNEGYVRTLMNFNTGDITSPFTEHLIDDWLSDVKGKIDNVSLYESIDVPTIDKGDIVFSELEYRFAVGKHLLESTPWKLKDYEVKEYLDELKKINVVSLGQTLKSMIRWGATTTFSTMGLIPMFFGPIGIALGAFIIGVAHGAQASAPVHKIIDSIPNTLLNAGDFFNTNYIDIGDLNSFTVTYIHKGKVKVGCYKEFERDLQLTNSNRQIVESVDGLTRRKVKFGHIKNYSDVAIDYSHPDVITNEMEGELLKQAYANLRGSTNKRIFQYKTTDLERGDHAFDLVGTDWIVYLHNGKCHLIAKNNKVFKDEFSEGKLEHSSLRYKKEQLNQTTFNLINQKSELVFYGQSFPLNTKFKFEEGETFPIGVRTIYPEDSNRVSPVDIKHVTLHTPHDYINTWIKLDKSKPGNQAKTIDPVELELMKHQMEGHILKYEQEKFKNETFLRQKNVEMVRRRVDLDNQWWDHTMETVANAMHLGTSTVKQISSGYSAEGIGGAATAAALRTGSIFRFGYDTYKGYRNYNIGVKRLSEDKELLFAENLQHMFQRKQNYEHHFKGDIYRLNAITRGYTKVGINDRESQELFNKQNNLTDINLHIFLPTQQQTQVIKHMYETYGCECLSPRFAVDPLFVKSGEIAGLYQFSKILGDNLVSNYTTDLVIGNSIRANFENGLRFTKVNIEYLEQSCCESKDVLIKDDRVLADVSKINEWAKEEWDRYFVSNNSDDVLKNVKKLDNFGLTKEEIEANPTIKDLDGKELLDKLNEIISHRETGKIYIVPITPEKVPVDESQLVELKDRLNRCNENIQSLNAQVEQTKRDVEDKNNQIQELQREIQKKQEAATQDNRLIVSLTNENAVLKTEKRQLTNELKKCQDNQEQADTIKNLQDQIKQINLDKKSLEDRIKSLSSEKENLENQKADVERQLKEHLDVKARLDEEIKQHKIDKETLTQQLNDERRRAINEKDEINKLKKQVNTQQKELQERQPVQVPLDCQTLKAILKDDFELDIKERDNGWNALRDLVFDLANRLNYLRSSQLDQRLTNYREIRQIVDKLQILEEIPIMDKAMDVIKKNNWNTYAKWINDGGDKPAGIEEIETEINRIQNMETTSMAHMLKPILDEANYLTFVAKRDLHDEITEGSDLETFLKHVYPGKNGELYKELYGEPEIAIIKKRFNKEITCHASGQGVATQDLFDDLKKTSAYKNVFIDPRPAQPIDPTKAVECNDKYKQLLQEKNRLQTELEECKKKPAGGVIPTATKFIDQVFPTTYTFERPPYKYLINEYNSDIQVNGGKDYYSGMYYCLYFQTRNKSSDYIWVMKPTSDVDLGIMFVQNLMNCIWDYWQGATNRLKDFTKLPLKYSYSSLYHRGNLVKEYNNLAEGGYSESILLSTNINNYIPEEKELSNVIINALVRTSHSVGLFYAGRYLTITNKPILDHTPDNDMTKLYADSRDRISVYIRYIIWALRNKPWNEAYPLIKSTFITWPWLKKSSYPQ